MVIGLEGNLRAVIIKKIHKKGIQTVIQTLKDYPLSKDICRGAQVYLFFLHFTCTFSNNVLLSQLSVKSAKKF